MGEAKRRGTYEQRRVEGETRRVEVQQLSSHPPQEKAIEKRAESQQLSGYDIWPEDRTKRRMRRISLSQIAAIGLAVAAFGGR